MKFELKLKSSTLLVWKQGYCLETMSIGRKKTCVKQLAIIYS